jgi:protein-disulfide isomerase
VAGYVFVLATVGLAAILYYAYTSFFVLKQLCPLCMAMYVAVVGIFIVAASAADSLASLPSGLGQDVEAVGKNGTAAALAGAWVVASIALVLLFPREQVLTAEGSTEGQAPAPVVMDTLTAEQLAEWKQWLDSQPRVEGAGASGDVKVLVMKFNDYQCPACKMTYSLYRDLFTKWEAKHPGVFKYESRDFPLEAECGAGGNHSAACEAAVAVRLAREKGRDKQLEALVFDRQSFSLTRGDIVDMLEEVAQVPESEYDARYASLVEAVRADSQLGTKLGVTGTPTFYLNGIRMPTIRPAHFEAAIAYELEKAGVMP